MICWVFLSEDNFFPFGKNPIARIHGFIQIHGVKVGVIFGDTKIMILTKAISGFLLIMKKHEQIHIYIYLYLFGFLTAKMLMILK